MKIFILGSGCKKCENLEENTRKALQSAGKEGEIQKITDPNEIMDYAVMMTPALVIDGKVVSSGKVLSPDEIKKLLP